MSRRRPSARRQQQTHRGRGRRLVAHDKQRCPLTGKYRYIDETSARRMMNNIRRSVDDDDRTLPDRAYQCLGPRGCGGWHLTSSPEL